MSSGNFLDISARIRQVRGKLKKSEFADALGIPRPNLSRYESGRTPPAEVLQKIADYGGVTVKWLLTGKEEKKDLEQDLSSEHPKDITPPPPPVEIQEFLLAEVLRAVEDFFEKNKGTYELEHRARLITAVYNRCARTLEPPSFGLVEFLATEVF
jgi:transcriptional regulator with XRE-family HTH domain